MEYKVSSYDMEEAGKIMISAAVFAKDYNHDFIGTEHLLYGVLVSADENTTQALYNAGSSKKDLVMGLYSLVLRGNKSFEGMPELTPRGAKAIESSFEEAWNRGGGISQSDFIIGLYQTEDGLAQYILEHNGFNEDAFRASIGNSVFPF